MKTNFSNREFLATLKALGNILVVVTKSSNYQDLLNSGQYTPDLNLNDAVQALEETNELYKLYMETLDN